VSAIAALNGMSWVTLFVICCGCVFFLLETHTSTHKQSLQTPENITSIENTTQEPIETEATGGNIKIYRQEEVDRVKASLLANSSILIVGEEGSGKSTLAYAVVDSLEESGFEVAFIGPASLKQMLLEIAEQLEVETQSLEGKSLNTEQLKTAIATYLQEETAFLIIDDAHLCDLKFRVWLKQLRRQGGLMFLLATDPPRSDIFTSIPRIQLKPLPEFAIREIMVSEALKQRVSLSNAELSKLQERAGGNPSLAERSINEEYLGIEVEGADHRRYLDITPFILIAGIAFVVMRSIGLGTNNQALYIFSSIGAALFLGVSRLFYNLPRESRRIR
jgi:ABC-type dipeptide/oligopeptide/nickel transport system ATPase subunit